MSKILIIDDDEILIELLQGDLEAQGHHLVLKATGAKEALKLFREIKPEVVIIDIVMPNIDGLELLRQFKKSDFSFKSIMLSGLDDDQLKGKALELGADLYLVKPVSPDQFKHIIQQVLLK